ncbi:MAG: choice-of-anchor D domain-containing protein [Candidatus Eisenbacteria bacterium]|nr:choice-of-anchor D domain-containing protein [Candidatus Eisenbacteria bacterium]
MRRNLDVSSPSPFAPIRGWIRAGLVAVLLTLVVAAGCQRDDLLGPKGDALLGVQVDLAGGRSSRAADTSAAIDRILVSATELSGGDEIVRASQELSVDPSDESFSVVLKVRAAARYRVGVQMVGRRSFAPGIATERGVLYSGEAEVRDLKPDSRQDALVTLRDVVPSGVAIVGSPREGYRLAWSAVTGAARYRVKELRPGEEPRELTSDEEDFPIEFGGRPLRSAARAAALLQSYRVAAELPRGLVSAYSESVGVVVPAAPSAVADLLATPAGVDSVVLTWTSPSDESGAVALYDLRAALFQITVDNFAAAATLQDLPAPAPPGRPERVILSGLLPDTRYTFALVSEDDEGNRSALSNVAEARTGTAPPVCVLTAERIDFAALEVGQTAEESFQIRNDGGGRLEGVIALSCSDASFLVFEGAGAFALAGGEARTVRVRFAPSAPGLHECSVTTGTDCGAVLLTGSSGLAPACALDRRTHDFGPLGLGESALASFTLSNAGGGVLEGTVPAACDDSGFEIVRGAGAYALGAGETHLIEVRFAPVEARVHGCTLTLAVGCGSIEFSGVGDALPVCAVDRTAIPFDPIAVGESAQETFTLRNAGGGLLRGEVALDCAAGAFSLTAGGGAYELAAGQERLVSVRFAPETEATHQCRIATGGACAAVLVSGRTLNAPLCEVNPTALPFPRLFVGEADEQSFTIANRGEGILTGRVSALLDPHFTVVVGAGDYALPAGQSRDVRVRFQPTAPGDWTTTLDLGTDCGAVLLSGSGEALPLCALSSKSLNFGALVVGETAERSFTVSNVGGGRLDGEIGTGCPSQGIEVVGGAGSFALAAGEKRVVTVRYTPIAAGAHTCAVGTTCGAVTAAGSAVWPVACDVSTDTLLFEPVRRGEFAEKSFTISNPGEGALSGEVTLGCGPGAFALSAGAGPYTLGPGDERMVTVRFAPSSFARQECLVGTGASCGAVRLIGETVPEPDCAVSSLDLDFPPTQVGESSLLEFEIQNNGGAALQGEVALDCTGPFSLIEGAGLYELAPGATRLVRVRFAPTVPGPAICDIRPGQLCDVVSARGSGYPPPLCALQPETLVFPPLLLGQEEIRSFEVKNLGGGTLTGSVPATCGNAAFSVVGGAGAYALEAGQSHLVQIRYAPTAAGTHQCSLVFAPASGCGEVAISGTGLLPPECSVPFATLDFGPLLIGETRTEAFEVTNVGQSPLSGSVSLGCVGSDFLITAGEGPFTLGPGETLSMAVRYLPTNRGSDSCELLFGAGSDCNPITLLGVGELPPTCEISTSALDFDLVAVGDSRDLLFTLENVGDRLLEGSVAKSCVEPHFQILSGEGNYALAAGQQHTVVLRYAPIENGTHECTITTGQPGCPAVDLTGFTQFCITMPATVELIWGAEPTDLDLHLWTPPADGVRYHVYYGEPGLPDELPFATLDQDDQDGFGPEVLTVHQLWPTDGEYVVGAHHFVGDGTLAGSGAYLRVTSGDGRVREFPVPTNDDRPGLWWDFAHLDRQTGCFTIVNQLRADPPVETLTLPAKAR